jgi:hypothetical protein
MDFFDRSKLGLDELVDLDVYGRLPPEEKEKFLHQKSLPHADAQLEGMKQMLTSGFADEAAANLSAIVPTDTDEAVGRNTYLERRATTTPELREPLHHAQKNFPGDYAKGALGGAALQSVLPLGVFKNLPTTIASMAGQSALQEVGDTESEDLAGAAQKGVHDAVTSPINALFLLPFVKLGKEIDTPFMRKKWMEDFEAIKEGMKMAQQSGDEKAFDQGLKQAKALRKDAKQTLDELGRSPAWYNNTIEDQALRRTDEFLKGRDAKFFDRNKPFAEQPKRALHDYFKARNLPWDPQEGELDLLEKTFQNKSPYHLDEKTNFPIPNPDWHPPISDDGKYLVFGEPRNIKNNVEDPFGWHDSKYQYSKKALREADRPVLIRTSSDLIGHDDYAELLPEGSKIEFYLRDHPDPEVGYRGHAFASNKRLEAAAERLRNEGHQVDLIDIGPKYTQAQGQEALQNKTTAEAMDKDLLAQLKGAVKKGEAPKIKLEDLSSLEDLQGYRGKPGLDDSNSIRTMTEEEMLRQNEERATEALQQKAQRNDLQVRWEDTRGGETLLQKDPLEMDALDRQVLETKRDMAKERVNHFEKWFQDRKQGHENAIAEGRLKPSVKLETFLEPHMLKNGQRFQEELAALENKLGEIDQMKNVRSLRPKLEEKLSQRKVTTDLGFGDQRRIDELSKLNKARISGEIDSDTYQKLQKENFSVEDWAKKHEAFKESLKRDFSREPILSDELSQVEKRADDLTQLMEETDNAEELDRYGEELGFLKNRVDASILHTSIPKAFELMDRPGNMKEFTASYIEKKISEGVEPTEIVNQVEQLYLQSKGRFLKARLGPEEYSKRLQQFEEKMNEIRRWFEE